jgi:hypothetical protein
MTKQSPRYTTDLTNYSKIHILDKRFLPLIWWMLITTFDKHLKSHV